MTVHRRGWDGCASLVGWPLPSMRGNSAGAGSGARRAADIGVRVGGPRAASRSDRRSGRLGSCSRVRISRGRLRLGVGRGAGHDRDLPGVARRIGPVYGTDDLARWLPAPGPDPLTTEAVRKRAVGRRLAGFRTDDGQWAFPAWQFDRVAGRLVPRAEVTALWRELPHDSFLADVDLAAWMNTRFEDLGATPPPTPTNRVPTPRRCQPSSPGSEPALRRRAVDVERQQLGLRPPTSVTASAVKRMSCPLPLWRATDARRRQPWWYSTRTRASRPGRFDLEAPRGTCYWVRSPQTALVEKTADPAQVDPPVLSVQALAALVVWRWT